MPRFEDSNIEWPTNEYVWKTGTPDSRKRLMRQLIASGKTHLFREVAVEHPDYVSPYNAESLHDILNETEDQFAYLGTMGIKVPDIAWRIVHSDHRGPRVFVKINVIEGYTPQLGTPEAEIVHSAMRAHFDTKRPGRKLFDIDPLPQYVVGVPRGEHAGNEPQAPQIYLVDLDARFA
jgi:hypothetical protein